MTAMIGQLLKQALPASMVASMLGKSSGKWKGFFSQALAAGYGAGEIIDFLQPKEAGGTERFRNEIERREQKGVATSRESALKPEQEFRPGQMLSQAAQAASPLALLGMAGDALEGGQPQQQPPPVPQAPPASPNASPSNKNNVLTQLMKKAPSNRPLSVDALQEQSKERRVGQMASGLAGSMAEGFADVAPNAFGLAKSLMDAGQNSAQASLELRKSAKKNIRLAKELAQTRQRFGTKLEDVLDKYVGQSGQQAQPQQQSGSSSDSDSVLALINSIIDGQ